VVLIGGCRSTKNLFNSEGKYVKEMLVIDLGKFTVSSALLLE
jgi:hypothetical protein